LAGDFVELVTERQHPAVRAQRYDDVVDLRLVTTVGAHLQTSLTKEQKTAP
jgi:hypothetical protein